MKSNLFLAISKLLSHTTKQASKKIYEEEMKERKEKRREGRRESTISVLKAEETHWEKST